MKTKSFAVIALLASATLIAAGCNTTTMPTDTTVDTGAVVDETTTMPTDTTVEATTTTEVEATVDAVANEVDATAAQ